MSVAPSHQPLPYQARARIADNLLLQRRRLGLSQARLAEDARVASSRICQIENGKVVGMLDTYVRLAGTLGVTLGDLLDGVRWTLGTVDVNYQASYVVEREGSNGEEK